MMLGGEEVLAGQRWLFPHHRRQVKRLLQHFLRRYQTPFVTEKGILRMAPLTTIAPRAYADRA